MGHYLAWVVTEEDADKECLRSRVQTLCAPFYEDDGSCPPYFPGLSFDYYTEMTLDRKPNYGDTPIETLSLGEMLDGDFELPSVVIAPDGQQITSGGWLLRVYPGDMKPKLNLGSWDEAAFYARDGGFRNKLKEMPLDLRVCRMDWHTIIGMSDPPRQGQPHWVEGKPSPWPAEMVSRDVYGRIDTLVQCIQDFDMAMKECYQRLSDLLYENDIPSFRVCPQRYSVERIAEIMGRFSVTEE